MSAPSLEGIVRKAVLLDMALMGAVDLASHSTPGRGWEATLSPLAILASELAGAAQAVHDRIARAVQAERKKTAGKAAG